MSEKKENIDGPWWMSSHCVSTGKSREFEWYNGEWVEVEKHGPGEAEKAYKNGNALRAFPPWDV